VALRDGSHPDYLGGLRRIAIGGATIVLIGLFLIWRVDNARVERLRILLIDQFVPSFDWTIRPIAATGRMIADLGAYQRVYEQNAELRRELQRMQGWREAALQLEQRNARLLALNNVRLSPRLTFVTGEIMADAGSPFRRSAMVNVGAEDGVVDGSAVMDGLGLVGRIAGVATQSSRIIFLSDSSSRVPAMIQPSGQRAIVAGDNTAYPVLEFLESPDTVRPGDRIVSSGDGGLYPPDILIGQVATTPDGRHRALLSADYGRLDYVRVIRHRPAENIAGPGDLIGPLLTDAQPPAEPAEAPQ
jgi:rod shape-determining protein MreC